MNLNIPPYPIGAEVQWSAYMMSRGVMTGQRVMEIMDWKRSRSSGKWLAIVMDSAIGIPAELITSYKQNTVVDWADCPYQPPHLRRAS